MANMTLFNSLKDVSGGTIYAPRPSLFTYRARLAAGTPSNLTIPAQAKIAIFSYGSGGDVVVDYQNTASEPVSATFTLTTSELNPSARDISQFTTLSFICATNNDVYVSFYTVNGSTYS